MRTPQGEPPPIFVVGPSRSGTSLMQRCLSLHPELFICGETHYFDDLRVQLGGDGTRELTPAEQQRCEDYFLGLGHRGYGNNGNPEQSRHSREDLRSCAKQLGSGADAYFEAFCRLEATAHGKARWGEKTPRHVFRIGEMLIRYPNAKVICMVRDPRAVVVSRRDGVRRLIHAPAGRETPAEIRRKSRSYDPLVNGLMWRSVINAGTAAAQVHGKHWVRFQRFEDLVQDSATVLPQLTEWLGLEFSEEMLDAPQTSSSYDESRSHQGFQTRATDRWRERLNPAEVAIIQSACRSQMRGQGYDLLANGLANLAVPAAWARLPFTALRAMIANSDRSGSIPAYVWRRLRATLGR